MDKIKSISIELNPYYLTNNIGCKYHILINDCVWYADNDINKIKSMMDEYIDMYIKSDK